MRLYVYKDSQICKYIKSFILFQTAFVIFYMITAPLFGYLGDRYSRKWILVVGLSMWSLSTLFGSFARNFWVFMFWRALVGIGEASYSTIGMLRNDYIFFLF